MNTTLKISAKCSNLLFASLHDETGKQIGRLHDGYVPSWFGEDVSGDYVDLTIDIVTGQIVGWKQPSNLNLVATFGKAPKTTPIKKCHGWCHKAKGSVTVKGKTFDNLNDLPKAPNWIKKAANRIYGNDSHLKLKRDAQGHFIKMDDIARFQYPHKNYYGILDYLWRKVKIVKQNPNFIEGIENNANGRAGYKKFLKSKMIGKVIIDKGYLD